MPKTTNIYDQLYMRSRDRVARRLSPSDRAFVRAQMYLRTSTRRDEETTLREGWKAFFVVLLTATAVGWITLFVINQLASQ